MPLPDMRQNEAVCLHLLRRDSASLYCSVLFAPAVKRSALAALLLFRQEILRIGTQAKEPLPGEMRLQYWRQVLQSGLNKSEQGADNKVINSEETGGGQSPAAAVLLAALERWRLPFEPLLALCDAARFDIYSEPMADSAALGRYCDAIYGATLRLACYILKGRTADELSDAEAAACRAGGMAQGLAALLRHLPRHMAQGKFYIPSDLAAGIGASKAELESAAAVLRKTDNTAERQRAAELCRRAAAALCAYCRQNYKAFVAAERQLSAALRPAFLPLAALPIFIAKAERRKEAVFAAPVTLSPLAVQLRLFRAALFNRF